MTNKLQIEDKQYPDGRTYKQVILDGSLLGGYDVTETGYLPFGKRKSRATQFEAILEVIATHTRKAVKRVNDLEDARDEVFERQSEFKT